MTKDIDLYEPTLDLPLTSLPDRTVRAAALTVCEQAHDRDDAALILDALGLRHGGHLAAVRTYAPPLRVVPPQFGKAAQ